jgi:DNA primase
MRAAERAFADDQKFMSQTFVAIEPTGLDPCDLRLKSGDTAVLDLVARRIPLVEFVLRSTVGRVDLDTAEGRAAALDRGVPLVAQIKDHSLRDEYARRLAGLVGVDDPLRVVSRVRELVRRGARGVAEAPARPARAVAAEEAVAAVEREVLKVALQLPAVAGPQFDALREDDFVVPAHRAVRAAVAAAGGTSAAVSGPAWVERVEAGMNPDLRAGLHALAVEPLHTGTLTQDRYADAMMARFQEIVTGRQVAALKSRLQRINPQDEPEEHARLFGELISLESHRRTLRERAIG